jgi:hypothetical protein
MDPQRVAERFFGRVLRLGLKSTGCDDVWQCGKG